MTIENNMKAQPDNDVFLDGLDFSTRVGKEFVISLEYDDNKRSNVCDTLMNFTNNL